MKRKFILFSSLSILFFPLLLVIIIMGAFAGSASSNGQTNGLQTKLTAKEVAQKANISEERASDVIKILNHELSQEQFTIAGASGSLAVAERESGFDPKAVNTGEVAVWLVISSGQAGLLLSMAIAGQRQNKRN